MSDVSQGPGWWIASDGRWYPPEQHPDAATRAAAVAGDHAVPVDGARAPARALEAEAPDRTAPVEPGPGPGPPPEAEGGDTADLSEPPAGEGTAGHRVADEARVDRPALDEAALDGAGVDASADAGSADDGSADNEAAGVEAASQETPAHEPADDPAAGLGPGGWVTVEVPGVRRGPAHARGRAPTSEAAEADEGTEAAIRGLLVLLAVAVVAGLLVLVIGNSSSTPSSTPTTSSSTDHHPTTVPPTTEASRLPSNPDQVVTTAVAAADREGSVHVDARLTLSGQPIQFDLDVGRIGATGTVVEGGAAIQVIITGATVYVQGSSAFLIGIGMTAAEAARYTGMWLAVPATTKGLTQLGAFNFASLVDSLIDVAPPRSLSYPTGVSSSITLVHGSLPSTPLTTGNGAGDPATLTVASAPPFLPSRTTASDPSTGVATYAYSLWGENVVLLAPSGAVPLAQAEGR